MTVADRAHDLPPFWDGHAVLWEGWEYEAPINICPPPNPPERCEGCGEPPTHRGFPTTVRNRGLVAVWPTLTHDDITADQENRARLGSLAYKRKPRALWRLRAIRCQACSLDTIWDVETDEWWTLDLSDYGDTGSQG